MLFHQCTFCTEILYLAIIVLYFHLYSPGLHRLCSEYLTLMLASFIHHEETQWIMIPMNCLPYVISANVHSCVKELVEPMKLQKKR